MRGDKEYQLSSAIATYLKLQYPDVVYHFDPVGVNLSKAQAGKMKAIQHDRGYPDLFIARSNKYCNGLYLELKVVSPYLKDGKTLKKSEHLEQQRKIHEKLRKAGYWVDFVVGFDLAKEVIDHYLKTQ